MVLVEQDRARLFTDFRYAERARELEGVEVEQTERFIYSDLAGRIPDTIGFEADAVTYANHEVLRESGASLVPRRGLVESLRAVKEPGELEAIREASRITDRVYERLAEEQFSGRTEKELVWRMTELFHELGADEPAFAIDIAAGPTAASPHAVPGDRVVQEGDLVLVDAGARLDHYCSDCTRTFAVGEDLRLAARDLRGDEGGAAGRARRGEGPGTRGRDADAAAAPSSPTPATARTSATGSATASASWFTRRRRFAPESKDTLEPGNVVTVEPGIYLSGVGGVQDRGPRRGHRGRLRGAEPRFPRS